MAEKRIAVLIGSLRKESYNRKMANNLISMAPSSLKMEIVEIGGLPMYNQESDDNPPDEYKRFRETIKGYDGFLFLTPEYNRSVPAVLKNAIDVGSRPYGQNVWGGKPGAVVSVSPGTIGGFGANHHLRQVLACINIPVMPFPETYIANAGEIFDKENNLSGEQVRKLMLKFIQAFAKWIDRWTIGLTTRARGVE